MKQAKILSTPRSEVAQEDSSMEATKSVHLRPLTKEREDAVNGLVQLD